MQDALKESTNLFVVIFIFKIKSICRCYVWDYSTVEKRSPASSLSVSVFVSSSSTCVISG